jgi:RHS repeat-associated protein
VIRSPAVESSLRKSPTAGNTSKALPSPTLRRQAVMVYAARWYDPYLNRWLQPDTIIPDPYDPLSFDRYAYVRNNPVNRVDPSGHCDGDPSDVDNPDIDCWNLLFKIQNTYSNVEIHDQYKWTLEELTGIWNGLLGHVFIKDIIEANQINFYRRSYYQRQGDSVAGYTDFNAETASYNIFIYDFAYYAKPDGTGIGNSSITNFTGTVVHELGHVAMRENPFILESYEFIDRGPRVYGWAYNFGRCSNRACRSEEEIAMAASTLQLSPASFNLLFYTDQRKSWIELFYRPNPLAHHDYGATYITAR